ncbi:hypothetical protein D3C83_154600 [compost metagenome]
MNHDLAQLISAAPEILDLLDQVEKGEQHQQRREYERRGGDDLAGEIAPQDSHLMNRNSENTVTRR